MKKLLLLLTVVTASFAVKAQKVNLGAKSGLNISSLSNVNPGGKSSSRTSFHVGGVVEIGFSNQFSLQPELVYSMQGAKWRNANIQYVGQLGYLQIPVIAKYYVIENLSLEAGPQLGFNLNANVKAVNEATGASITQDQSSNISSIDFGLNFGFRYHLGLTDVLKSNTGDAIKNGVIQISAGYFFM